ncbi:PREDICTED: 60S ribosome subunit biogenesis protein NIP7 homolog isoform X2 [Ceratosolen solmsi marchali]|uniref:60S ribosome subunit biogenesis protein NIP7 homolog n=1 Tax=Ceratosolen solmsi marchali TaxID=326594 RepID=A0AAJ6VJW1_9HYME|nr:PREDICTED: 60S ribosome subunit biogenesis protein NIP7 homolog isoform X2 [Ceratosolen solmsi marchali]XP_011494567.1 PREDICTED: 60S ribosome subunit biogenesis protein NIP7 homolog isoform X2 [Ceratosolen solmsi marchali]XP_011494569.1 PREDICTED: 60S ribosome subunit biogenesis protein NIP7 homolog isoform X2 [Ceratosolen solmsi marchali]XP_011494570.1 PREDICTED: 60S ribosome subunit biogenesis protein NIP7 homolog isoform X2 [Ceratosolen solmsi marchali]XP_011494571.1 PREDICTED: 60S ribos
MRRLSEDKKKLVYEKLTKYIGDNMKFLIDRPDGTYCFRIKKERVYYVLEKILGLASSVSSNDLMSVGTCIGKFTKSGKFRLHITALHYLAPYATHKIWVKPSAEQQFLYGNNINKAGLGKITENTSKYQGVVVYSMNDLPLGFGVAAKSTLECACADPMSIICFHQADIGEYIRCEDTLL